jgi:hypothetical protein
MSQKPPPWADLLLTVWVAVVAAIFFGPIFVPAVGLWTAPAGLLTLLMVMAAAVTLALRLVPRRDVPETPPSAEKRPRKGKRR